MIVPQVFLPEGGRPLPEDDREQDITYATSAQFPVPIGTNDLPDLPPLGPNLAFAVTADRRLVTVNKGQVENETAQGFWICDKCGTAAVDEPAQAPHARPYAIEFAFNQPKPSRLCDGTYHKVFLGHVFSTDLLLMRFTLRSPMATDTNDPVVLRALEDALYSVSEALRLAASRHAQLDLDPSEFGSGFRIVAPSEPGQLYLDVYLYDTLAGGAGYAELAGRYLTEILADVLKLLEHCPTSCDRSCESCLRHYHNQHLRDRLDRFIGAQLLRYGLSGEVPPELAASVQAANLRGLGRLLQLDGFKCSQFVNVQGRVVPLLVERGQQGVAIGTQSGLVQEKWDGHSIAQLQAKGNVQGRVLNEFILRRNLPDEHQLIRSFFQQG